ncbi:MAG: hypothetical protein IJR17_02030 [Clostridia bacterium]|nr:hypothetical protein [Clostridia bacterium]
MKRDCRKYSRTDLIEIIYELKRREMQKDKLLHQANHRLQTFTLQAESAGSLMEAAARITGLFEAAQETARIYVDSIQQGNTQEEGERSA